MSSGPGLAVAVVDGFEVGRVEAQGVRRDALLQAGSISKPVAALVALRLVEQGSLELDGDVNETLGPWRLPATEPVTLRQLLSHTAGTTVESYPGYERREPLPSLADVLDGRPPANTGPVRVEATTQGLYRYSGGGYVVVQRLVSDAAGAPFHEVAAELVLRPLGMRDSTFEQPLPPALHKRAASGYASARRIPGGWHVYPEAAAAGLWTTPHDLARFVCSLQQAVAGRSSPIARETAALMLVPHVELPPREEWAQIRALGVVPPDHIGLGLFLAVDGTTSRFSHLGSNAGFTAALDASATDGTGVVAMTNRHGGWEDVLRALGTRAA